MSLDLKKLFKVIIEEETVQVIFVPDFDAILTTEHKRNLRRHILSRMYGTKPQAELMPTEAATELVETFLKDLIASSPRGSNTCLEQVEEIMAENDMAYRRAYIAHLFNPNLDIFPNIPK